METSSNYAREIRVNQSALRSLWAKKYHKEYNNKKG